MTTREAYIIRKTFGVRRRRVFFCFFLTSSFLFAFALSSSWISKNSAKAWNFHRMSRIKAAAAAWNAIATEQFCAAEIHSRTINESATTRVLILDPFLFSSSIFYLSPFSLFSLPSISSRLSLLRNPGTRICRF